MKGIYEKVEVLEETEQSEICDQAQVKVFLSFSKRCAAFQQAVDAIGTEVVDGCGKQQWKKKTPIPTCIKEATGKNQKRILRAVGQQVVAREYDRQEDQKFE